MYPVYELIIKQRRHALGITVYLYIFLYMLLINYRFIIYKWYSGQPLKTCSYIPNDLALVLLF